MKFSVQALRRYLPLPESLHEICELMDDVGLEVKRAETHAEVGPVVTLELLANRGDHHAYEGVARELSGRIGGRLARPPITPLTVGPSPIRLVNETPQCLLYTATLLERTSDEGALDATTLVPLTAADIHSLSAPVDATNLSNFELGQPTHAFDADTIRGGITIRSSRAGETAWPLFHESKIPLPEGTLVIADDEKILAIAGVIGCEESKTTATTRRLLLESACFDPVSVRKAGRALDIQTDSRARFERGSDPSYPLVGAGRVVHLLEAVGWRRVGATGVVGDWVDPKKTIRCDLARINAFLETRLSLDDVKERLQRYGFSVDGAGPTFDVRVPPHRLWDVDAWADIAEELWKSVGYNATPTSLPSVDMGSLPSLAETNKAAVEDVLLGHGFYEVFTDGFYGRSIKDAMGLHDGHPLAAHVETLNSVDRGFSLLKNQAMGQALAVVADNQRRRLLDVRAYEWTRTFHPDATADNGVCHERPLLWAIAVGGERTWAGASRTADVYLLKGIVEEIAVALGVGLDVGPWDDTLALGSALHPGRRATIRHEGRIVGVLGEVHPERTKAFKIRRGAPVYLELDRSLLATPGTLPVYEAPPQHQPILRSLAFGLVGVVTAGDVAAALHQAGPDYLERVAITDLFETTDPSGGRIRAVTFELTFTGDGTRTADTVNANLDVMVRAVESSFAGVRQRA